MGISVELFKHLLAQDNFIPAAKVILDGIPSDATICGVQLFGWTIWLDIESESFPELKDGDEIPFLNPVFETQQAKSA